MRRGSRSVTTLTVPESLDLTACKAVYITFAQGGRQLTQKTGDPGVTIGATRPPSGMSRQMSPYLCRRNKCDF